VVEGQIERLNQDCLWCHRGYQRTRALNIFYVQAMACLSNSELLQIKKVWASWGLIYSRGVESFDGTLAIAWEIVKCGRDALQNYGMKPTNRPTSAADLVCGRHAINNIIRFLQSATRVRAPDLPQSQPHSIFTGPGSSTSAPFFDSARGVSHRDLSHSHSP
jgi:hypothetical protein